jgi:hypothetical protein
MTTLLQQAIDQAKQLPPEDQDAVAAWMLEAMQKELRWQELFAKSQDMLAKMGEEALAEMRAGKTQPLDPDAL